MVSLGGIFKVWYKTCIKQKNHYVEYYHLYPWCQFDPFRVGETQHFVVIQHCVHVLNPYSIDWAIAHYPLVFLFCALKCLRKCLTCLLIVVTNCKQQALIRAQPIVELRWALGKYIFQLRKFSVNKNFLSFSCLLETVGVFSRKMGRTTLLLWLLPNYRRTKLLFQYYCSEKLSCAQIQS